MAETPSLKPLTLETAYVAYEALIQLGIQPAGPKQVLELLQRLDTGLPAEDEFMALVTWLGRCVSVTKLDQRQSISSRSAYKIPDLLAIFRTETGRLLPVLIEVKTSRRDRLKWSNAYRTKLEAYASACGLPLLVAWRPEKLNMWLLFESGRLANGPVGFGDAMVNNLMSALAGDFAIVLKPGVGIHFVTKAEKFLGDGPPKTSGLLSPGPWQMRIEDAYFTNGNAERLDEVQPGLWQVLLAAADLALEQDGSDDTITVSYVVKEQDTGLQLAQRILPSLVWQALSEDERPHWRQFYATERFPVDIATVRQGMRVGFGNNTVQYVLDQLPTEMPSFLVQQSTPTV